MIEDIKKDADRRMNKSIEALSQDFTKLRTGRAHTSLLDHITVEYYGNQTPLNQVGNVTVLDPRTLGVNPWDKKMTPDVEKAIRNSDLGLNPVTSGDVIRVPLPPLTEERRKDMIRLIRQEAENTRVAIRNIRRDAIHSLKDLIKDEHISEDEERRAEDEMQKLTDKHIAEVEKNLEIKEKDVMEV